MQEFRMRIANQAINPLCASGILIGARPPEPRPTITAILTPLIPETLLPHYLSTTSSTTVTTMGNRQNTPIHKVRPLQHSPSQVLYLTQEKEVQNSQTTYITSTRIATLPKQTQVPGTDPAESLLISERPFLTHP